MSLEGSRAIITGASRGLGASLAVRLARAGCALALGARDTTALAGVAERARAEGVTVYHAALDVTERDRMLDFVRAAEAALGGIDILINNAGSGSYKPFLEHDFEEIETTLRVNLEGPMILTRAVLPGMVSRGRGKILNIASDLSRRPLANMAGYVAAKHGIAGFAGSLVREVKDQGVRVMTLMPGIMDTHFSGPPGNREQTWAMDPDHVAELAHTMLTQPAYLMTDEVCVHPMHQDF